MQNKGITNEAFIGIFGILVFAFIAFMFYSSYKDVLANNSTDLYELIDDDKEFNEQYVSLYIDKVIGNYAETKHTFNGIPIGKDQHYLIMLDDGTFISVTVNNKKLISELEEICNSTWNYIDNKTDRLDKSIVVKGIIGSMNTELQGYCNEWLVHLDVDQSNMRYVSINTYVTVSYVIFALGFCLFFIGLMLFFIICSSKKKTLP